jgi:hypothetical protein
LNEKDESDKTDSEMSLPQIELSEKIMDSKQARHETLNENSPVNIESTVSPVAMSEVNRKAKEIERLQQVISKLENANEALMKRLCGKNGKPSPAKSPQKTQELLDQSGKLIERKARRYYLE